MNNRHIEEMLEFYLPLLVTAGDYALAIQPEVARNAAHRTKQGHNPWVAALTDADLSVQNFLEVHTLARYPNVRFYGEEHATSNNQKYFPETAEFSVHVDPINGTFLYRSGRPGWDIIVSIAQGRQLVAALSYVPVRGTHRAAIRGCGARTGSRGELHLADFQDLRIGETARTCVSYQAPDVKTALAGHFECFDLVLDDDPGRGLDNLNEIFTGRLGAFACRDSQCLDWGAAALLAVEAGGFASDLDGRPLAFFDDFDPEFRADMLVSANSAVHREILELLQG
jgi:fructose-1,6-bisphosphatase/inositol monophosphatase family enzyme